MSVTDDQIAAARRKVRDMLHAAEHGSRPGELAVLRMANSGALLEALQEIVRATHHEKGLLARQINSIAFAAVRQAAGEAP